MLKRQLLIPLFCGLLFFACGEKERISIPIFDEPIITGYHLRDANGQPLGNVGSPNTNVSTEPAGISNASLAFFSYPNPSFQTVFQIAIIAGQDTGTRARVWLTPATYIDELQQANTLGASVVTSYGKPLRDFSVELQEGSNNLSVDTQGLPTGYYRIYLQRGNTLLWDNLYIRPQ